MSQPAVLMSGGLDSTVLLADEAARSDRPVQPVYVRVGLAWEDAEQAAVRDLLEREPLRKGARPLIVLGVDMRDVYAATHWAVEGHPPEYHTPDEDVYLPGRNIVLFGKAAVLCASLGIDRLAIGTLAHNPFPDATADFRAAMANALSLGLDHALAIDAPFAQLDKSAVIRRGLALGVPLDATMSCMNPGTDPDRAGGGGGGRAIHCGRCSKCRERHDAFTAAAVPDPTEYLDRTLVGMGQPGGTRE
jgi:7-cyano-7-deazaguanine synthase